MQFFSEDALQQAYNLSNGIPRLINILCDRALLGAYVEEKDQVSERIILKAAKEVFGKIVRKHNAQKPVAIPEKIIFLVFAVLLLSVTVFYFLSSPNHPLKQFIHSTIGISEVEIKDTINDKSADQVSDGLTDEADEQTIISPETQ